MTLASRAAQITLNYRQSSLGFKFAALNYRWSKKNRYAYRLQGFDDEWIEVDSSRLTRLAGWRPAISSSRGLFETGEWFRGR